MASAHVSIGGRSKSPPSGSREAAAYRPRTSAPQTSRPTLWPARTYQSAADRNRRLQDRVKLLLIARERARHKRRAQLDGQRARINRRQIEIAAFRIA